MTMRDKLIFTEVVFPTKERKELLLSVKNTVPTEIPEDVNTVNAQT